MPDAVVIGSGPNGLSAAVELAWRGADVLVLEARDTIGGGMRTEELTVPGLRHDICSGCHPMGILSPYWRTLPLSEHGLRWVKPAASVAHPLDDGPAVLLYPSVDDTAAQLGPDARAYERLMTPLLHNPEGLLSDLMGPLGVPRHPLQLIRFGLLALRSARGLAESRFAGERARALFAGCAGHSILPLERMTTAAFGLIFSIAGHTEPWPVAEGGSASIAAALASLLHERGGRIETGVHVRSMADLPPAKAYLFDTSPTQLADIAGDALPAGYSRRLRRYRYGPGVFKLDLAVSGPIPWRDPRCLEASTVHLGGTLDEIAAAEAAVWAGEHPENPYVLVVQQSQHDPTRSADSHHSVYAYCHVPPGSTLDLTAVVERQIERFAPGFGQTIVARHAMNTRDYQAHNPNYLGGAIAGGVADLGQLFTRPVARLNPYTTPNKSLFICSASTPPGGGVHGMCGFYAAKAAARVLLPVQGAGRCGLRPPAPASTSHGPSASGRTGAQTMRASWGGSENTTRSRSAPSHPEGPHPTLRPCPPTPERPVRTGLCARSLCPSWPSCWARA
ncbi:MAG: NAD(P)/FAD-dependent oxidoreductase [Deltaproteobacteria bacterium]|nr:NAD(P)/FAD-dependent oxidoreductase [Deltaproteobacteria bacterium]